MQEVLQADWQEAGHSPQPPVRRVFFSIALLTVWICFLICITSKSKYYYPYILPCFAYFCKGFFMNTTASVSFIENKKDFPFYRKSCFKMELMTRIELVTLSLPRIRSAD